MFWLKKFIGFWLMPVPFCLALLTLGWVMNFSSRRRALSRWLLGLGLGLLLLFGNKAFSTWLVRPLETEFSPIPEFTASAPAPAPLATCHFVVVLGGGPGDNSQLSAVNKLSTSAQGRLMEAIRILRALPDAKLVVSGRGEPGQPTHAAVLEQAAISLGVDLSRIVRFDTPRDTDDEAHATRHLVGDQPFALVTSAWHMRRAVALMRHAGTHPVPCPCDFAARPSDQMRPTDFGWDVESLGRSTRGIYERVGFLCALLNGKI